MSNNVNHSIGIKKRKNEATHCFYCETDFLDIKIDYKSNSHKTIDHFIPLNPSQGKRGTNANKNKVICCYWCNQLKKQYHPKEFLKLLQDLKWCKEMKKKFSFFTDEKLKIIFSKVTYLTRTDGQSEGHFIIKDSIYQKHLEKYKERMAKKFKKEEKDIVTVESRRYKNLLTNWLTYGT